jgi:hypothetical protein
MFQVSRSLCRAWLQKLKFVWSRTVVEDPGQLQASSSVPCTTRRTAHRSSLQHNEDLNDGLLANTSISHKIGGGDDSGGISNLEERLTSSVLLVSTSKCISNSESVQPTRAWGKHCKHIFHSWHALKSSARSSTFDYFGCCECQQRIIQTSYCSHSCWTQAEVSLAALDLMEVQSGIFNSDLIKFPLSLNILTQIIHTHTGLVVGYAKDGTGRRTGRLIVYNFNPSQHQTDSRQDSK